MARGSSTVLACRTDSNGPVRHRAQCVQIPTPAIPLGLVRIPNWPDANNAFVRNPPARSVSSATKVSNDEGSMGGASGIFGYRYAGQTKGRRYDRWREEFGRRWVAADFEPIGENYFVNQFSGAEHSFLALCHMRSTPSCFYRRSDPVSSGYRYVLVAAGSILRARQCGRSIDLSSGQMTLISADEPAEVAQITEGDRWSIRISHKILADCCKNVDDKIARLVDASDLTKLLFHHIETAHRLGPKLGASANHAIAQHTLDLVGLCLGAERELPTLPAVAASPRRAWRPSKPAYCSGSAARTWDLRRLPPLMASAPVTCSICSNCPVNRSPASCSSSACWRPTACCESRKADGAK